VTVPIPSVKEKSKVSARPGVDASANADANANAPKVIFFMTPSQAVLRDADMGHPSRFSTERMSVGV
jgi:hypothetical protein